MGSLIEGQMKLLRIHQPFYHSWRSQTTNAKQGGAVDMKEQVAMNRIKVSDEVIIAVVEMLGKVFLALIAAKAAPRPSDC